MIELKFLKKLMLVRELAQKRAIFIIIVNFQIKDLTSNQ